MALYQAIIPTISLSGVCVCVWSDSRSDIYNNSLYIYEIWLNETRFAY